MSQPTNEKCVSEVVLRIQTVLRDYLHTETDTLNALWDDGVYCEVPDDYDIQIGPEYNFRGDPVIGIEWTQDTRQMYIGPRSDHHIVVKLRVGFNSLESSDNIGILTARYGRCVWVALRKNYTNSDGTIHELELEELLPLVIYDPDTGIEGHGVELTLIAHSQFSLPPFET